MSKTARDVLTEQIVGPSPGAQIDDADAEAIIEALAAAGFVIVPVSETPAMLEAGREESSQFIDGSVSSGGPRSWFLEREQVSAIYRAMIAAAQEPKP